MRLAADFAADPTVHIPRVFWDTTTSRILTLERMRRSKISDREALDAAGIDRRELAERATRVTAQMVFEHGCFHADPHPGNFFVEPAGASGPSTSAWSAPWTTGCASSSGGCWSRSRARTRTGRRCPPDVPCTGASANAPRTKAERAFLVDMVGHHAMAVEMAEMAKEKATHEELKDLAHDIIGMQTAETDRMWTWLKAWYGHSVPEDHRHAGGRARDDGAPQPLAREGSPAHHQSSQARDRAVPGVAGRLVRELSDRSPGGASTRRRGAARGRAGEPRGHP